VSGFLEALPCSTIVYRTLTRSRDLRDGLPTSEAFLRRARDTEGLSVDYDVAVPDGCGRGLSKKRAVVSLHVGRIRDSGLDVIPDEIDHANIIGLPPFPGEDYELIERAEQMAAKLVAHARTAWVKDASP